MDAARLAEENMGLVYAAAKRFAWADRGEIIQSGCVGLMEAARRFDESRGVRFSTYAVPYILGEMRAFIRHDHAMHIPRTMQEVSCRAYRAAQQLREEIGREPTLSDIAARLDTSPEELAAAMESGAPPVSLDAPVSGEPDSIRLGDVVRDDSQQAAFNQVIARDILSRCGKTERALIQLRYFRGMTQAQAAKALGISQPQVCRMEKRVLESLRSDDVG